MDRSQYLHVHLPGRGRVTLSLPEGVERAIISGKLPPDAQVWNESLELWVPLARHPAITRLLHLASLPYQEGSAEPEASSDLTLEPHPVWFVNGERAEGKEGPPTDPAQLPLIPLEGFEPDHEFTQFLARASETEERRTAVRMSGPVRTSSPASVFVAGALELRKGQRRLQRLVARYQIPGWAAILALILPSTAAVGFFFLGRAAGGNELPIPVTVTNALSAGWNGHADSIATAAALSAPNPLAAEERDLENNLRIAEAVVWQPAIDFTPEQIGRSSRKLDALRNSISLYRIGAWRQIDSASRDSDPRLESYEEASRVDEVIGVLQSTVVLLDSLQTGFRVNGELLVFSESAQADRYLLLRHRADSLIHSPVGADSIPQLRAPRRVVTRLVETLPHAVLATAAP